MKLKQRLMRTVLVAVLCLTVACGGFAVVANAAVDRTAIFNEALDTDEFPANRWATSQTDSTAVGFGHVGSPVFSATAQDGTVALQYDTALTMTEPTTETTTSPTVTTHTATPAEGTLALQYDEAITLAEHQYVEIKVTATGLPALPNVFLGFNATKADGAIATDSGEGLKFAFKSATADIARADVTMVTANEGAKWRDAATGGMNNANTAAVDAACYNMWTGGGVTTDTDGSTFMIRIRDDGRAIAGVKGKDHGAYYPFALGWTHNGSAWVTVPGFTAQSSGYPQVVFSGLTGNVAITEFEVGVYSYTDAVKGDDLTAGTEVSKGEVTKLKATVGTLTTQTTGGESTTTTTYAKQYAEYVVSLAGVTGSPTVSMQFGATKATKASDLSAAGKEGIAVTMLGNSVNVELTSAQEGASFRNPWSGASMPAGAKHEILSVNGPATQGVTNTTRFSVKFLVYADGTGVCFVKDADHAWYPIAPIGWTHNGAAWVRGTGFTPSNVGYPQVLITGASGSVRITEFTAAVYDYTADDPEKPGGTLVEDTTLFKEDFASVENSSVKFLAGTVELAPAVAGLVVDNAADNDYLLKKTALSKPDDDRAPVIYDVTAQLFIEQLSGDAGAVVYLGATDTQLTGASLLKFAMTNGKVTAAIDDGEAVETSVQLGEAFTLELTLGGNVGETPYTNIVKVNGTQVGTFAKKTVETYIAFGTKGVTDTAKAKFAVLSASIEKHAYTPGDGGDFTETFDDNKYNPTNMTVTTQILEPDPNTIMKIENGKVVCDANAGYTTVISSTQIYGDFEMEFEISEWGDNGFGIVDMMISWGRPTGESTYDGVGTHFFFVSGGITCLDPKINLTTNPFDLLPTDKLDADDQPLEKSRNLNDYNFSEGNLVFKVVKNGTEVKLFVYTANSAADSESRTVPKATITNDYCGMGTVGFCAVPTGHNMSLSLDKFSVKNTDALKNDNLIVGEEGNRVELKFELEPEIPVPPPLGPGGDDDPVPVDPDKKDEEGCGCGSSAMGVSSVAAAVVLLGGAILLIKRRKTAK